MFTIEKEVAVNQVTADGIAVGTTTLEVSLTYIIERIELEGQNGIAFYTVTSGADTEGARNYIPFTYSGSGDPELEAEFALRCFLDGN
ncbi:TPA: hypothetical protein ACJ14G_001708 [Klebsiella pneumoniae]|uniref:hypothetical protein n=1 Tax=Klebsiella TaxID=570 RepID=UPI000668DBF8|nr:MULTISPECIES: hypothetical protein [Klebsiella]CAH6244022.1 hypothetical protein AN2336V5_3282 [Klebsiella oxytoca]DAL98386.1 MAG TPA: hypothetical protein [Caudoviricetes sp.]EKU1338734.1 hypothetical protein [Klebsiella pneumoniae]EKZ6801723.1 hypothetical protein [Klebsiella pneumoniae]ELF1738925.1 hypothetical protein [Klebsiella pneumoniae]